MKENLHPLAHRASLMARTRWPIAVVFVAGLVSNFRGIDNQDLWYDELETAYAVSTQLGQALDPYTTPYYFILQILTLNSSVVTDVTLRGPSAFAMTLAATFVAAATRIATKSPIASLTAGFFFILSPGALRLAQEARPYGFAALGSAIALFLTLRILRRSTPKLWLALSLTVLISTVIAPIVVFYIPTLLVIVVLTKRDLALRFLAYFFWVVPVGIVGLWASTRYSDLRSWLDPPTAIGFRDALIWISTSDVFGLYGATAFALAIVALTLTTREGFRAFVALLAGTALLWLGSLGPMSFWTGRTFIIFLPVLAMAASLAFTTSWVRSLAVLILLAIFAQPSHAYLREAGNRGTSWQSVSSDVSPLVRPGDRTADRLLFLAVHHYQPDLVLPLVESSLAPDIWTTAPPPCTAKIEVGGTSELQYFICRDSIVN